jgi:hypothetical protein
MQLLMMVAADRCPCSFAKYSPGVCLTSRHRLLYVCKQFVNLEIRGLLGSPAHDGALLTGVCCQCRCHQGEHGTGRNVAPYVEMEWGTTAYELMWQLKELFDPEYVLNPGVILNAVRGRPPLSAPCVADCAHCLSLTHAQAAFAILNAVRGPLFAPCMAVLRQLSPALHMHIAAGPQQLLWLHRKLCQRACRMLLAWPALLACGPPVAWSCLHAGAAQMTRTDNH